MRDTAEIGISGYTGIPEMYFLFFLWYSYAIERIKKIIMEFLYLCTQTILLWLLVIWLHRKKGTITLIPLYVFIGASALLTHNLSDMGFSVTFSGQYFFISSFSFFTALMLGVLFIYLFEGVRATRLALIVILETSFLYIATVFFLDREADITGWATITLQRLQYYFWSISAIVADVFFIAIFWELMGKIKRIPLFVQVFLVVFATFALDTLIFVSGFFGGQDLYGTILRGDLMVRLVLALVITPVIVFFLRQEKYVEANREKPKKFWEILDLHSDLENKLKTMEEVVKYEKELEGELDKAKEQYALALEGANAGIWDWDIVKDKIMFSPKFCSLLGCKKEDLGETIEDFKKNMYPEDVSKAFSLLEECFREKKPFSIEYRLKMREGSYRWYSCGGVVKFDDEGKPVRMVGSIIDIHEKKEIIRLHEEKVVELERFNKVLVDRELRMIDLKKEIHRLKNPTEG